LGIIRANEVSPFSEKSDLVPLLPPADGFVGLLAKAVSLIPDIGARLSKLVSEAVGPGQIFRRSFSDNKPARGCFSRKR
jgi:hypothetical protein